MNFLEWLQGLSEPAKKKVLVVATVVVMGIVVYFWLAYFNNLIANVAQPPVAENQAAGGAPRAGGASGVFGRIYEQFMRIPRILGNILQSPRQYIVHPPTN